MEISDIVHLTNDAFVWPSLGCVILTGGIPIEQELAVETWRNLNKYNVKDDRYRFV
jgi:hypothetical protein